MDLAQRRLSQEEWESLEVPIIGPELQILKMIKAGYNDVNITNNDTKTLLKFIKITAKDMVPYHYHLYGIYFKDIFEGLVSKYKITLSLDKRPKVKNLKRADLIRIDNTDKKINSLRPNIFEFVLLDILRKFLDSDGCEKNKHYYTLTHLLKLNITDINIVLVANIKTLVVGFRDNASKEEFISNADIYIERNHDLVKYKDVELYSHQKDLFSYCKQEGAKLITYQAPTGTGKTLSPIALASQYKIIFVCAAKHVGLQLAKACISLDIKIAVAFGCTGQENIRLHWAAAKETTRNRRTGGIFKVDNSVGDYVEIMICDVQSYIPAMHYMKAFNPVENMMLYWDEPTITLDYDEHPYHSVMATNWRENDIPNIILSSATLPQIDELSGVTRSFISKFDSTNIINIVSHDCAKTIPLLDTDGFIVLPHLYFEHYVDLKKSVKHLKEYLTLLRHFDVGEVIKFIMYVNTEIDINDRYKIDNYFESVESIDIIEIKRYYLTLLSAVKNDYDDIYAHFQAERTPLHESYIKITTADSHTLTDGPTMYLAADVEKIGQYCLGAAKIPNVMLDAIMEDIGINEQIRKEIEEITKNINKNTDKQEPASDKGKSKKGKGEGKQAPDKNTIQQEQAIEKCESLRRCIKRVRLGLDYIPNSHEHLGIWDQTDTKNAFTSSIDDDIVEKIMLLDVTPNWKFLLLMGIGVFALHACDDYVAIMKELALNQKLYLIIASTDYIYGTNYQFCHVYIGKDLGDISQEKIVQAFGRGGRSNLRQDYSIRLRSNKLIDTLFTKSDFNIEAVNLNRLFN